MNKPEPWWVKAYAVMALSPHLFLGGGGALICYAVTIPFRLINLIQDCYEESQE